MTQAGGFDLVLLPIGLGLLGFVEPCTLGSTLVFVKFLEGKSTPRMVAEAASFTVTRMIVLGLFGVLAALLGSLFIGLQKGVWIVLGSVYIMLGALYLTGYIRALMMSFGPRLSRLSGMRGSAGLGVLFGFNIPACAAPLLLVLLGAAAADRARGGVIATGFVSLALFGFALSLPLVVAVLFAPARRAIDWLGSLSRRIPAAIGVVLIALGLWSIYFGLFVSINAPMPGMGMPG